MKSIRSFVAIELSDQIKSNIADAIMPLSSDNALAIRWTPLKNVHLTLKFLGNVTSSAIENLNGSLKEKLNSIHKFSITIGDIGIFPNIQRPRIVWIGIQDRKELNAIFDQIENASRKLGIEPENRKFNPHLTIGRVKKNCSPKEIQHISKSLASTPIGFIGKQTVNEIIVYQSVLHQEGPNYYPLVKIPLID